MIRDRIVIGVKSKELQSKLMRVNDLTLAKAIDICRVWQATCAQTASLANSSAITAPSVNQVSRGRSNIFRVRGRGTGRYSSRDTGFPTKYSPPSSTASNRHQFQLTHKCQWCGHEKHDRKTCPARKDVCNY